MRSQPPQATVSIDVEICPSFVEELEIVINDLEGQFQSGVNLVLMLGLLEGYYIPHYLWHYTPKNFEEKVSL